MYSGIEYELSPGTGVALRIITKEASLRIAETAFKLAQKRKKHLTYVHKGNILRITDGIFKNAVKEAALNYPDVALDDVHIDAATMHLIKKPETFDVIVTTNLFGDILSDEAAQVTGSLGLAVLSAQQGLKFGSEIKSDVKPLNRMIQRMLSEVGGVVAMKDPTRGGLADALNEFSEKSKVGILIHEEKVPVREDVQAACEMLGLDPLEVGNEGKIIIGTVPAKAEQALQFLKQTSEGKNAEIIGEATKDFNGVAMQTLVGGKRVIARPVGDSVPRIC
jgi:hydrogenase expression/formation protein HypE